MELRMLAPPRELIAGVEYEVPVPVSLGVYIVVGVCAGKIAFFECLDGPPQKEYSSKSSHWRYWLLEPLTKSVSFPDFVRRVGGYYYGKPKFTKRFPF